MMKLAERVEDSIGAPINDQCYRFNNRSFLPCIREDGETDLRTLQLSDDDLLLLLSAGTPVETEPKDDKPGGLAANGRSAGSATVQETAESGGGNGETAEAAVKADFGLGHRLGGNSANLTPAERRKAAADAAARRFGK